MLAALTGGILVFSLATGETPPPDFNSAANRAAIHWGAAPLTDGEKVLSTGPGWFLGAMKSNGTWADNAWVVEGDEPNPAALNMLVDRKAMGQDETSVSAFLCDGGRIEFRT